MLDVIITILVASFVLGILIFVHEGGHYLAARLFHVRVSEFMLGLPGPHLSFKRGETRFGITCIPLGGYARVCGMESGTISPHLEKVLVSLYLRGTAHMEQVAEDCQISDDDAYDALEELVEWGAAIAPLKSDEYNTFRTIGHGTIDTACAGTIKHCDGDSRIDAIHHDGDPLLYRDDAGTLRQVADGQPVTSAELYQAEYSRQYISLPFWKRSVILLAGVFVNLLFAVLAFILIYSVIGFDMQNQMGEIAHYTVPPLTSVKVGFMYMGMVVEAVIDLFNPQTAAETINNSASIIGIAVISKSAFEQGFVTLLEFMAMISVSLGIMNLIPIPPLDGGRFIVEVWQKISRRVVGAKVMNVASFVGTALFLVFFVVMVNQDIQRFIIGG